MLGLPQPAMAHARSPGTDITSATLTSASVGLSSASVGLSSHLSGPAQASPHYWPRSALSASGLHTSLPIAPPHANALAHSLSAFSLLPSPVHPTAPPASAGAVHAAHPGPAPGSVGLTAASGPPPSGATSLLSPVPSPAPALHALQAAAAAAAGVVRLPVSHVMLGTRWQRAAPQVRVHVDPLRHELAYTVVAPATGREDPGVSPSTLRLRVPLGDIVSWDVLPAAGPAGAVGSAAPSAAAAAAAAPVDGKSLLMELPGMPGAADGEPERFASLPMDTLLLRVKRRPACEIATGGGWTAVPDGLEQPEGTVLLHRLVGAGLAAAWCRARDLAGPAFHFLASPPAMPAAGAAGASASPMADPASGLGKVLPGGPAGLGGATSGGDVSAEAFMESLGFAEAFPTPPTTTDGGQGALAPPLSPPPPPGSPRVMSSLAAMPPMPPMPPSLLS
ncbi:hypothetical protein CXG81DRAFT_29005 [Caulochytrium protostelioides]|uniref:Uncharacterized protein n=1 Tax=Caulochytrium protostelioides TaxID=1555241 RepID=A0A4P9X2B3_9FUNG|nr:hypothetical protein CXG81DRAFT_29005 [Caulochytrium protostelioides]|eukprot:RKO98206.1 hypothetical protein CXG81DRAFT_29005 [Caulochytrium protostelioides]